MNDLERDAVELACEMVRAKWDAVERRKADAEVSGATHPTPPIA